MSTTSSTVLRAELGRYQYKVSRDIRKLKWQHKVRNTPKKGLPALADRAVWEKVTKPRAGIWWDSIVEKAWKGMGGNQEDVLSMYNFRGHKAEVKERMDRRERLALRNKGERGGTLKRYSGG